MSHEDEDLDTRRKMEGVRKDPAYAAAREQAASTGADPIHYDPYDSDASDRPTPEVSLAGIPSDERVHVPPTTLPPRQVRDTLKLEAKVELGKGLVGMRDMITQRVLRVPPSQLPPADAPDPHDPPTVPGNLSSVGMFSVKEGSVEPVNPSSQVPPPSAWAAERATNAIDASGMPSAYRPDPPLEDNDDTPAPPLPTRTPVFAWIALPAMVAASLVLWFVLRGDESDVPVSGAVPVAATQSPVDPMRPSIPAPPPVETEVVAPPATPTERAPAVAATEVAPASAATRVATAAVSGPAKVTAAPPPSSARVSGSRPPRAEVPKPPPSVTAEASAPPPAPKPTSTFHDIF